LGCCPEGHGLSGNADLCQKLTYPNCLLRRIRSSDNLSLSGGQGSHPLLYGPPFHYTACQYEGIASRGLVFVYIAGKIYIDIADKLEGRAAIVAEAEVAVVVQVLENSL